MAVARFDQPIHLIPNIPDFRGRRIGNTRVTPRKDRNEVYLVAVFYPA
jgi:hypothetical protein